METTSWKYILNIASNSFQGLLQCSRRCTSVHCPNDILTTRRGSNPEIPTSTVPSKPCPWQVGGGCKFRSMGAALDCLNILGLCPSLHSSFKPTLAMSLVPIRMCEFISVISARHCIFHRISIIIVIIFMHWELGSVVVVEGRPSRDHSYSQVWLRGQTQR